MGRSIRLMSGAGGDMSEHYFREFVRERLKTPGPIKPVEAWNAAFELASLAHKLEIARMRQALEITAGNIKSIKNAVGIGVITYDVWLALVEEALIPK